MRIGWIIALAATACSNAFAEGKLIQVDPRADSWNFDYGEPIKPALARLVRTGQVRKATASEVAKLRAIYKRLPYSAFADVPVFVLLKRIPVSTLNQFGGGYMVNFIVPATVRQGGIGDRPGSNFFNEAGQCLGGPACDPVPSAPPSAPARPRY
jgi:hypothetical protein